MPQAPQPMPSVDATLIERGQRYGKFIDVSKASLELRMAASNNVRTEMAPDQQEAINMILHKLARILVGDPDYVDNWHDIAGYATLVEKRLLGNPI